jgi:tripartite-type tricarboxylate transporter receptor subunit TctC
MGPGVMSHEGVVAFAQMKGLEMKLVPFSGIGPSMTALLGGHVMVWSSGIAGF